MHYALVSTESCRAGDRVTIVRDDGRVDTMTVRAAYWDDSLVLVEEGSKQREWQAVLWSRITAEDNAPGSKSLAQKRRRAAPWVEPDPVYIWCLTSPGDWEYDCGLHVALHAMPKEGA